MFAKFLVTASLAALLGAAPVLAQEAQPQGMGQQDQSGQIYKKKMNQQQGQATGNQQGQPLSQQQSDQTGAQGTQPTKKLKKSQQAGDQNQTTKKKLQNNTQTGEMNGQKQPGAVTEQGQTNRKLKKQQAAGQKPGQEQMTTGATGQLAVAIPAEKRTMVRQKFVATHVQRISRAKININLRVGVRVPRTIHFYPIPETVVEVVPAYRDYLYFALDDGTIVIVDPGTYEVVYVLTA